MKAPGDRVLIHSFHNIDEYGTVVRHLPNSIIVVKDAEGIEWKAEAIIVYRKLERIPRLGEQNDVTDNNSSHASSTHQDKRKKRTRRPV